MRIWKKKKKKEEEKKKRRRKTCVNLEEEERRGGGGEGEGNGKEEGKGEGARDLKIPAYEPPAPPVASPSFAVDLNGSVSDEIGTAELLPTSVQCAAPVGAGEGLFDDLEDDDVESTIVPSIFFQFNKRFL
ncbi:hypothetical protein Ahy_A03g011753 [Arachis hypogaea]|uniref:Uncharacterized protein n=1 Tax=Arachis hypogaea TaxID=3818 RepID=A0A445DRN1_ARAHY|nr:hypothetical protein Ahy_A03g011753 [Arachis hypogaea]